MDFNKLAEKEHLSKKFSLSKSPNIELLTDAILTAIQAPPPGNIQPLKFLITEDKKNIEIISEACQQPFIKEAPYIIVVCSDKKKAKIMYESKAEEYINQYSGAAIQNLLLKLTESNLAYYWVRYFSPLTIRNCFEIPEEIKIEAIIPVGYKNKLDNSKKPPTFTENLIYFHDWKNKYYKERRSAKTK